MSINRAKKTADNPAASKSKMLKRLTKHFNRNNGHGITATKNDKVGMELFKALGGDRSQLRHVKSKAVV